MNFLVNVMGWVLEHNNAYVSVISMQNMLNTFSQMADSDENLESVEITEEQKQNYIDGIKDSYPTSEFKDFTTKSDINGVLTILNKEELENTNPNSGSHFDLDKLNNIKTEDGKIYLFVTDDMNIIMIYADEDLAMELLDSYSLEGEATDPITEEELNEKIKESVEAMGGTMSEDGNVSYSFSMDTVE